MGRLGYRPGLDGVRGLAIAPVVALHAFGWPRQGSLGVDVFFVLSGFLITTLLLEERAQTGAISFGRFYRRRAARLFPGLFLLLIVYAVAVRGAHASALFFAATYTTNIAHLAGHPGPHELGHLWSLAQEEQFYLVWPPLLLLLSRARATRLPWLIGMILAAVLVEKTVLLATGASQLRIYGGPDTHADPILIGCLFGALFATGRAPSVRRLGPAALATVAAAVLADRSLLGATSPLRTVFAFACAIVILAAVEGGIVARILSLRPLRFLGQISYSLYLWHLPVLAAAGATVWDARPVRAALVLPAVLAVSCASFYLVERPLRCRWRLPRERTLTAAVQPTT